MRFKVLLLALCLTGLIVVWQAQAAPTGVGLGEPGLSFRYVETYGTVEEAYVDDSSHINIPYGVTVDGNDNLWIAEWAGARALKFNSSGNFLMQLGRAGYRFSDGDTFYSTADTVVDSSGNIWVSEFHTHRVAQFDSSGNFLMELGQIWNGGSDNSHFDSPRGLAVDSNDNLYIVDTNNHRIQIYNSSGSYLATLGETGVFGTDNDHFDHPRHMHIDSNDRLYVGDSDNHRVQIFDITSPISITHVTTIGETGVSGSDNTHFDWPFGVAADANHIYVVDVNNHRVQVFNASTFIYETTIGTGSPGSGNNEFNFPIDVDVNSSGALFVADWSNYRVQQFDSSYNYVRTFGTTGIPYATTENHFHFPTHMALTHDGGLLIAETNGHRLIKLNADGTQAWAVGEAGVSGNDNAHLNEPHGMAVASDGRIFLMDSRNDRLQIFDSQGNYLSTFGSIGNGNNQFLWPHDIAIGNNGDIYILDSANQRVQIYDSNFNYLATIGETGVVGNDNDHFFYPKGIAVDSQGTIYVADDDNRRVQVFDNTYTYQYSIGIAYDINEDCLNTFDRLCGDRDLAVDSQDRVYIADAFNNVFKFLILQAITLQRLVVVGEQA